MVWFHPTAAGQGLFAAWQDAATAGTTPGNYVPELYVGTSGYLYGEFWDGAVNPMKSAVTVNDGMWHNAVLVATASATEELFVDGTLNTTMNANVFATTQTTGYAGGGFIGGAWPDEPHSSTTSNTGYASSFNGSIADVAVVWAVTDEGIRGFLVPRDTPGFTTQDIHRKLSLRASDTSELVMQDVHVPGDAMLAKSGGLKSPLMCLTQARYGIAWGSIGAAMACYEEASAYACNRVMFGKPIGEFQLQQARLADMLTEIVKGQLLTLHLGRLKDAGRLTPQQVSLAKRNNVWMALECARKARDILGAAGITDQYSVIRHVMNLETVSTYEGTHDIHTLVVGRDITGINAFGG